jgi:hypothetical protein
MDSDDDELGDEYDQHVFASFNITITNELNEFDAWFAALREKAKSSLMWWSTNYSKYLRLALMMRDACAVPPSESGFERQFSIAGCVATRQRNQLSLKSICEIMMYKNHMDRMRRGLDISVTAVDTKYEIITESEVEDLAQSEDTSRTFADWILGWNAGMKR